MAELTRLDYLDSEDRTSMHYLATCRESATGCYCRVSSYKQKDDLDRQVAYLRERDPDRASQDRQRKAHSATNGQWINRDEVRARNSLLRALVETANNCIVAVAKCSF
jgi:predicted site-specific integrase-resolvase